MANMIKKSVLSFPVFFEKTEEVSTADERFTKVKVYMMHTGLNYNNSIFEQSVIKKAMPTLEYIPIVGFIEKGIFEEKDFSDHRYIIVKDEKGIRRKYMGSAYGVIKSSDDNNAHFEMRMCDDGIEREFLVVDGIIWNMFEDSSDIVNRDVTKGHSMELWDDSVEGFEDEDGKFHFTGFSFRAACILGDKYEPAMQNSTIEVQFTVTDFIKSIQGELNNKYTTFTKLVEGENNQGGNKTMPKTDFSQTVMEQFSDISATVSQYEMMVDRWGDSVARYSLVDIQDNEVIVVDRKNNYQYYGFPFTMNGDKAEIDFACGKRKKTRYENYEEGTTAPEGAFDFGSHIKEIEETCFNKVDTANKEAATAKATIEQIQGELDIATANYSKVKTDYDAVKGQYDEIAPKYDAYVKAEEKRINDELNAQKDAQFARFESALSDDIEFAKIKQDRDNLSVKDIEEKCSVLFTRKNLATTNFSKSNKSLTTGLMDEGNDDEGYVATKYGNIPIRR